ncbi:hypothetical protein O6P43_003258 [Quillaja saponaria]|uniref:Uncharacterized protein n=1 Tax=Quillaja saponaria TaxID=32244 RepID=A0AAD7VLC6_QUISA|nr:hypothetical protein O6P43_003258 [Quillaja saponaria]
MILSWLALASETNAEIESLRWSTMILSWLASLIIMKKELCDQVVRIDKLILKLQQGEAVVNIKEERANVINELLAGFQLMEETSKKDYNESGSAPHQDFSGLQYNF